MKHNLIIFHLKLMFCICLICFGQVIIGSAFVFTSTILTEFRKPTSTIKLTVEEESWITSICILVCPIGLLFIGVLTDKYGKRKTIQITLIPMIISWLLLAFANSYATIMIARVILGIPIGLSGCMLLYISEICPADVRSVYSGVVAISMGIGMTVENLLSLYVDWRVISGIMSVMSAMNLLALFAVPEPPMWLRANGHAEEADKVAKWLDPKYTDSSVAVTAITVVNSTSPPIVAATFDPRQQESSSWWTWLLRPTVWKPTLITILFFMLVQGTGIYVLILYSMDVAQSFRLSFDGVTVSLFLSVARIFGAVVFLSLHGFRRRPLVAISSAIMAVSLIIIIASMRAFGNVREPPTAANTVMVVAFITFIFASLLGVFPVAWILCSEVFPMPVKGVMSGIVQSAGYVFWFAICKIYPLAILHYGTEIVWSVFTMFCVLNMLFALFIMPETKGKSLDEISLYFESREKSNKLNVS